LGALGFAQALEPLLAESRSGDSIRRMNAALALIRLDVSPAIRLQVRDAVLAVYKSMPATPQGVTLKTQLIAAMAHMYDAAPMDLFLSEASNRSNHVDARQMAAQMYAFLADKAEAQKLQAMIDAEPASAQSGYKEQLAEYKPLLDLASKCDRDLSCWKKNLTSNDAITVRKSAYMLGRFGNASSVDSLVEVLDNPDLSARLAVLMAIDHLATTGSPAAVQKLEDMQDREEGRTTWVRFRDHALPVHARLISRQRS
jgi:HEAT repeat protein